MWSAASHRRFAFAFALVLAPPCLPSSIAVGCPTLCDFGKGWFFAKPRCFMSCTAHVECGESSPLCLCLRSCSSPSLSRIIHRRRVPHPLRFWQRVGPCLSFHISSCKFELHSSFVSASHGSQVTNHESCLFLSTLHGHLLFPAPCASVNVDICRHLSKPALKPPATPQISSSGSQHA